MCTNAGRTPLKSLDGVLEEDLPNHLLVDDKHGILYCDLAKVGSTTWLTSFAFASGLADRYQRRKWIPGHSDEALSRYNLRRLHTYEPDERRKRLESYLKFIVVRHPYDRLVAAWRNKFLQKNFYTVKVAPGIIKTYRQQGVDLGNFVTFDEFIQHVLHEGALSDPHWLTYESCKPCLVEYEYISRTETMQKDDKLMKLLLGVDRLDLTPKHVLAPADLYKTTKTLPQFQNISEHHMNKLNDMYGADLRLFGYHFDKSKHEASCEFEGRKCC
ncbi:hypothetical protein CAPTEDRAFT_112614 [Capitella teleta]|uniref:Carbohydrate sulfotransferase n=1 Tax=Capitella teleta TaxID=283909 RepID=R7VB84_CAPTE|nr:hypothetical protein CAPTEDRAFT_112614 [Capitella teleta]|eukprot:ELU16088.1 hypothetical protein CAPTEDRAFT_112614 [Capitella teleta]